MSYRAHRSTGRRPARAIREMHTGRRVARPFGSVSRAQIHVSSGTGRRPVYEKSVYDARPLLYDKDRVSTHVGVSSRIKRVTRAIGRRPAVVAVGWGCATSVTDDRLLHFFQQFQSNIDFMILVVSWEYAVFRLVTVWTVFETVCLFVCLIHCKLLLISNYWFILWAKVVKGFQVSGLNTVY